MQALLVTAFGEIPRAVPCEPAGNSSCPDARLLFDGEEAARDWFRANRRLAA